MYLQLLPTILSVFAPFERMDLIRLAKSASDWTSNELEAYNIVVQELDAQQFFGDSLPEYTGPAGFIQFENLPTRGMDAASVALVKRLDLAMTLYEGEESAVDDFAAEVLRAMGYETDQTVVRTRKTIRLLMCGERVYAKTDVCVLDIHSGVLLVVQEDKSHLNLTAEPEPQLIAEGIATFQHNNLKREESFLEPLKEATIPGITMVGTFPTFYKIRVTEELNYAIRHGLYPPAMTTVYRHTPRVPRRRSDGMKPLDNRKIVLRCYEAFKRFVPQSQE